MSRQSITARLVAVVGNYEAQELLETPNFALGGRTPDDLLGAQDFAPVEQLVKGMELDAIARSKWIKTQPLAIEAL